MKTKLIRRLVEALLAILCIALAVLVVRSGFQMVSGEFGSVVAPTSGTAGTTTPLGANGFLDMTDGQVRVENQPLLAAFVLAGRVAIMLLLIGSMLAVRSILLRLAEGEAFAEATVAAMRRIGFCLLGLCGVSLGITVIKQASILSIVGPLEGKHLHPSLSWNVPGVENIWMDYSPPLMMLMLAGLALIAAEAFKSGMEYRQDSENVV